MSQGMILTGLFFLEIILLFLFSRSLTQTLARLLFLLTHSRRATVNILALLFLPGTIIHELSHVLAAGMMLVPVGKMEILPEMEEEEIRLGSAEIGQTDILRRVIIGMAPLIVGLAFIISLLWIMQGSLSLSAPFWQVIILLYVVFEVGNTMFSSKKDLEGALAFFGALFLVTASVLGMLYYTGHLLSLSGPFESPFLIGFLTKASIFLAIPVVIDIIFLSLARAFGLKSA